MRLFCNQNRCYFLLAGVIVLASVFAYLGFAKPPFPRVYFAETSVRCLPQGTERMDVAWKMHLDITVDGVAEVVPANIGNTIRCTTELHTHQSDGTVSIELYDRDRVKALSFGDFFGVWGVPVERQGYSLTILSDGKQVGSLKDIPLRDGGRVTLEYVTIPGGDAISE